MKVGTGGKEKQSVFYWAINVACVFTCVKKMSKAGFSEKVRDKGFVFLKKTKHHFNVKPTMFLLLKR